MFYFCQLFAWLVARLQRVAKVIVEWVVGFVGWLIYFIGYVLTPSSWF